MSGRVALALSCLDGRAWPAVADWLERNCHAVFVDLVTAPGLATVLAEGGGESVRAGATLSVQRRDAVTIAVAAHSECLASPISDEMHKDHVIAAAEAVAEWGLGVPVVALFVDSKRQARKVHEIQP